MKSRMRQVTFDWKLEQMNQEDEKQLHVVIDSIITEMVFKYLREKDRTSEQPNQATSINTSVSEIRDSALLREKNVPD